jgi:hypothetical protein
MSFLNHLLYYGDLARLAFAHRPITPPRVSDGDGDTRLLVDKKDKSFS